MKYETTISMKLDKAVEDNTKVLRRLHLSKKTNPYTRNTADNIYLAINNIINGEF